MTARARPWWRAAGAAVAAGSLGWVAGQRHVLSRQVRHDIDRRRELPPPPGEIRLSVVVPAYGEATRIGASVARLRADLSDLADDGGLEIVVVDDGSPDGTAEAARLAGADVVIRHDHNRGKGAAVRTGMLAAHGRTLAFTDADLSYAPEHLRTLTEGIEAGWDVVTGSRRHTDTTTLVRARRVREIGGRAINALTHLVLLGQHRDTQCGLKAFRSDVARLVFSHTRIDGFAFDVEVFHLVERYRFSLTEVPVRVENSDHSTVRVVQDGVALVRDLFRVLRYAQRGEYDLDGHEMLLVRRG